jgi:hypothetical protein
MILVLTSLYLKPTEVIGIHTRSLRLSLGPRSTKIQRRMTHDFHVKQSKGFPTKLDGRKEQIEDLDALAHVSSGYIKLWRNLFKLFTDKWQARGETSSSAKQFIMHVKKVWAKLTWSRAFLPPGAPQTNNAVESFNRDFKRDVLHGARPAVFDCAKQLLGKAAS